MGAVHGLLVFFMIISPGAAQSLADFQARFDREPDSVQKVKVFQKLGAAQLEEALRTGKDGNYDAVGLTLEKYRDNVRAALEA